MNIVQMAEIERNKATESSVVYQAKLFGDALRKTLQKMRTDCVDLMVFSWS